MVGSFRQTVHKRKSRAVKHLHETRFRRIKRNVVQTLVIGFWDDIVVRVRLTAPKEIFAKGPQAEVVITDTRTKKVVARHKIADVYIGPKGWTFVPVYVANVACRPLNVTATGGGKRIQKSLQFSCGE